MIGFPKRAEINTSVPEEIIGKVTIPSREHQVHPASAVANEVQAIARARAKVEAGVPLVKEGFFALLMKKLIRH